MAVELKPMSSNTDILHKMDVAIIGAGISGLTAAFELLKKDQKTSFVIFEGKDRVGGRTRGQELKCNSGTAYWDVGGQWIGSCQPHITKLVEELSLDVYPQHHDGAKVLQLAGDRISTYKGDIPSLPFYALIDLYLFIRKIEKMRMQINLDDPCCHGNAAQWDNMTLDEALHKFTYTNGAREVITATGRCVFGAEPAHMSFLYYLYYVQAAGGVDALITASKGGGQELKIKGGAFQICQRLLTVIGHKNVRLNSPVTKITQSPSGVEMYLATGEKISCARVILALPPSQTAKIHFEPPLPADKLFVMNRMPPSCLTKVIVTYETAFWRSEGFSGEAVTSGGSSIYQTCPTGPLCIVFDGTSERGDPALIGFIGGDQQIFHSMLPGEARRLSVLHGLNMLFGSKAYKFLDYAERNWSQEAYSGGCPVCVGTPGVMGHLAHALRRRYSRIHFAGTESATAWCGFMNGAVQAGERAANEVLHYLDPSVIDSQEDENLNSSAECISTVHFTKTSKKSKVSIFRWILLGLGSFLTLIGLRRRFFQT